MDPLKLSNDGQYKKWITNLKLKVRNVQIKAALSVNKELLNFYWTLGADLVEMQTAAQWGDGFLVQLSDDLMAAFPEMKGFSLRNLKYIKQWYLFYNQQDIIGQQVVAQFVDEQLKKTGDERTIGILLCKGKDKTVAEYALSDIHKPMGVTEYQLTQALPDNLRGSLPSVEEIEAEMEGEIEGRVE